MEEYLNKIEETKKILESFPMEITEGTKKLIERYKSDAIKLRNEKVEELLVLYQNDLDTIKNLLKNIVDEIEPKSINHEIEINKNKINLMKKVMNYNNEYNDYYDKSGFNKIIDELDDIQNNNLHESNDMLLSIIDKAVKVSIKLGSKDFNYSPDTLEYMEMFFENLNSEDFADVMAKKFEEMYWNCPNLLTQLKLNAKYIALKTEKYFQKYCADVKKQLFIQSDTDEFNYENSYENLRYMLEKEQRCDEYTNLKDFLENKENIDNYLVSSIYRNDKINSYVAEGDFNSFTSGDKIEFYNMIEELGYSIYEYKNYLLFMPIVKDLVDKYKEVQNTKPDINTIKKEIIKAEKIREKKLAKYMRIAKSKKDNSEKLLTIKTQINEDINKLADLYNQYEDSRIKAEIIKNINENSTIYDALKVAGAFRGYLKKIIIRDFNLTTEKEINDLISSFNDFIYNPRINILKKINLFSDANLPLLINQKCKLCGIKLKDDFQNDLDTIEKDINYMNRIHDIEKGKLSIEDMKFICDVKKILM